MSELNNTDKSQIKVAVFEGTTKEHLTSVEAVTGKPVDKYRAILKLILNHLETAGASSSFRISSIREALANMIMHRDYEMPGFSTVSLLDDRIEFLSLGGIGGNLTITDIMNGASFCRNPQIAQEFEKEGLAKNLGSGLQIIENGQEDGGTHVVAGPASFLVVLEKANGEPARKSQELPKPAAGYDIPDTLPPEERVYELLKIKKIIGRKDVELLLHCSSFPARQALLKLLEQNRITPTGNARSTKYVLKQ